jgi:type I restriction enzyme S subunit
MRSQSFQNALDAVKTHGSMVADYVSISLQHEFVFKFPDVQSQRSIGNILGLLDDKIELNRQMNGTLEAMARALFKSWFVDFDPVRAKAEGRDPHLPKLIADMFPDNLEDSEVGIIPEGWQIAGLGEVLQQRVERCTPSADIAALPYVPIDCISPRSLFLSESKPGTEAHSSLTRFNKGDILFGAMRPYFHKVCIAPFNGTTRTTAFVLFPRRADDFGYGIMTMHDPETVDYATRHSTGSTIPYAVWGGSLENMPIVLPPEGVRAAFGRLVRPLLARISTGYFEVRALTALRDALLPKLISGELRMTEAERVVAEATA